MDYKLFGLDEAGHIVFEKDLLAYDDLAALREAEAACDNHVVEVWQGARRVARVKRGNAPLRATDRMSL
ncbi:MAG TPA: hypothetical protein VFI23_10225 [Rhizomicrobium sp.]|nr:hypothetical protein [Rhizomicrobium sp.]